mmetsp:Transcript_26761/g.62866  ORF Transcript_26761/g.62866 Transcript_26761/m.62866 type:complete len:519 (+) Transcript_26761:114-1670(+)
MCCFLIDETSQCELPFGILRNEPTLCARQSMLGNLVLAQIDLRFHEVVLLDLLDDLTLQLLLLGVPVVVVLVERLPEAIHGLLRGLRRIRQEQRVQPVVEHPLRQDVERLEVDEVVVHHLGPVHVHHVRLAVLGVHHHQVGLHPGEGLADLHRDVGLAPGQALPVSLLEPPEGVVVFLQLLLGLVLLLVLDDVGGFPEIPDDLGRGGLRGGLRSRLASPAAPGAAVVVAGEALVVLRREHVLDRLVVVVVVVFFFRFEVVDVVLLFLLLERELDEDDVVPEVPQIDGRAGVLRGAGPEGADPVQGLQEDDDPREAPHDGRQDGPLALRVELGARQEGQDAGHHREDRLGDREEQHLPGVVVGGGDVVLDEVLVNLVLELHRGVLGQDDAGVLRFLLPLESGGELDASTGHPRGRSAGGSVTDGGRDAAAAAPSIPSSSFAAASAENGELAPFQTFSELPFGASVVVIAAVPLPTGDSGGFESGSSGRGDGVLTGNEPGGLVGMRVAHRLRMSEDRRCV